MKHFISTGWILAAALLVSAVAFAANQLTVQVSETRVRKDAKFWAPSVVTVSAGEKLTELSHKGAWYQVKSASGKTGWVHQSAVTTKKIALSGGSTTAAQRASSDEIALAGKGFSEEVEEQYRKANAELDFAAVDAMVAFEVSDESVVAFLKEGKLADWGGAQ